MKYLPVVLLGLLLFWGTFAYFMSERIDRDTGPPVWERPLVSGTDNRVVGYKAAPEITDGHDNTALKTPEPDAP